MQYQGHLPAPPGYLPPPLSLAGYGGQPAYNPQAIHYPQPVFGTAVSSAGLQQPLNLAGLSTSSGCGGSAFGMVGSQSLHPMLAQPPHFLGIGGAYELGGQLVPHGLGMVAQPFPPGMVAPPPPSASLPPPLHHGDVRMISPAGPIVISPAGVLSPPPGLLSPPIMGTTAVPAPAHQGMPPLKHRPGPPPSSCRAATDLTVLGPLPLNYALYGPTAIAMPTGVACTTHSEVKPALATRTTHAGSMSAATANAASRSTPSAPASRSSPLTVMTSGEARAAAARLDSIAILRQHRMRSSQESPDSCSSPRTAVSPQELSVQTDISKIKLKRLREMAVVHQLTEYHKSAERYNCDKCNYSSARHDKILQHLLAHRISKHVCQDCNKAFIKACDLDRHSLAHQTGRARSLEWRSSRTVGGKSQGLDNEESESRDMSDVVKDPNGNIPVAPSQRANGHHMGPLTENVVTANMTGLGPGLHHATNAAPAPLSGLKLRIDSVIDRLMPHQAIKEVMLTNKSQVRAEEHGRTLARPHAPVNESRLNAIPIRGDYDEDILCYITTNEEISSRKNASEVNGNLAHFEGRSLRATKETLAGIEADGDGRVDERLLANCNRGRQNLELANAHNASNGQRSCSVYRENEEDLDTSDERGRSLIRDLNISSDESPDRGPTPNETRRIPGSLSFNSSPEDQSLVQHYRRPNSAFTSLAPLPFYSPSNVFASPPPESVATTTASFAASPLENALPATPFPTVSLANALPATPVTPDMSCEAHSSKPGPPRANTGFRCQICSYEGRSVKSLQKHYVAHNQSYKICQYCSKAFERPSDLLRHEERHLLQMQRQGDPSLVSKGKVVGTMGSPSPLRKPDSFKCRKCDWSTNFHHKLMLHQKQKHPARHDCEICGNRYISKSALGNHITRAHSSSLIRVDDFHRDSLTATQLLKCDVVAHTNEIILSGMDIMDLTMDRYPEVPLCATAKDAKIVMRSAREKEYGAIKKNMLRDLRDSANAAAIPISGPLFPFPLTTMPRQDAPSDVLAKNVPSGSVVNATGKPTNSPPRPPPLPSPHPSPPPPPLPEVLPRQRPPTPAAVVVTSVSEGRLPLMPAVQANGAVEPRPTSVVQDRPMIIQETASCTVSTPKQTEVRQSPTPTAEERERKRFVSEPRDIEIVAQTEDGSFNDTSDDELLIHKPRKDPHISPKMRVRYRKKQKLLTPVPKAPLELKSKSPQQEEKFSSGKCSGKLRRNCKFFCKRCNYGTNVKFKYDEHLKAHYGRFICKFCNRACLKSSDLFRHWTTHEIKDTNGEYVCDTCEFTSAVREVVEEHLKLHYNQRLLPKSHDLAKCGQCDKTFTRPQLFVHKRLVHSKKKAKAKPTFEKVLQEKKATYRCPACDTIPFDTLEGVHAHYETAHISNTTVKRRKRKGKLQEDSPPLKVKPYVSHKPAFQGYPCLHCDRVFRKKGSLNQHELIHKSPVTISQKECSEMIAKICSPAMFKGGRRRKRCPYCYKAFRSPYYLKTHVQLHAADRPHRCDGCGVSFSVRTSLDSHRKLCRQRKTEKKSAEDPHHVDSENPVSGDTPVEHNLDSPKADSPTAVSLNMEVVENGNEPINMDDEEREEEESEKHSAEAMVVVINEDAEGESLPGEDDDQDEKHEQQQKQDQEQERRSDVEKQVEVNEVEALPVLPKVTQKVNQLQSEPKTSTPPIAAGLDIGGECE